MDRDLLYRFFEGTVSEEEGMTIRTWMEESPDNKRTFYKERKLFDAIMLNSTPNPIAKSETPPRRPQRLWMQCFRLAGIVVLTLCLNYLYQQYYINDMAPRFCTISVPAGQRANITLPDGTNVWLNARTVMEYSASFDNRQRIVRLNGEAYFDVQKDKNRPFIVQTKNHCVEVMGTKFNVDAYADNLDGFETTLMQGSVKINSKSAPNHSIMLTPDHKISLHNGKLRITSVQDYDPYRWREGLLCFKEASFADIMKDFEKYYGIDIVIENKQMREYKFTGKFRQSDGVDYALRILQKNIQFTYEKDNDKQIIYIN